METLLPMKEAADLNFQVLTLSINPVRFLIITIQIQDQVQQVEYPHREHSVVSTIHITLILAIIFQTTYTQGQVEGIVTTICKDIVVIMKSFE